MISSVPSAVSASAVRLSTQSPSLQYSEAVESADLGLVDVAADDAVAIAPPRFVGHHFLERGDEADRVLDLVLDVLRQRPVGVAHARAQAVEPAVQRQDHGVAAVAQIGQPARVLHHAVEEVAVGDQKAPAVGGDVDHLVRHFDVAEGQPHELPRHRIVVAGHVDHARALARLAQQLLHHVVVGPRPVPAAAQLPAVDDVADQIQRVGFVVLQKIEQITRLAAGRSQVDVGNPQGAVVAGGMRNGGVSGGEAGCLPGGGRSLRRMAAG